MSALRRPTRLALSRAWPSRPSGRGGGAHVGCHARPKLSGTTVALGHIAGVFGGAMAVQADPFEIVGRRIEGKYEVVEVVDQTSFSVVYRATHVVWKRDVAIKAFKVAG